MRKHAGRKSRFSPMREAGFVTRRLPNTLLVSRFILRAAPGFSVQDQNPEPWELPFDKPEAEKLPERSHVFP
jgi:hypothetical protein